MSFLLQIGQIYINLSIYVINFIYNLMFQAIMDKIPDPLNGAELVKASALNVRVAVLIREMESKNDAKIKEIRDVKENGRSSFISRNPQIDFEDVTNAYYACVEGSKVLVDYIESKYPDLYGIFQTAYYQVH
mgnify:CR=1 FL=1